MEYSSGTGPDDEIGSDTSSVFSYRSPGQLCTQPDWDPLVTDWCDGCRTGTRVCDWHCLHEMFWLQETFRGENPLSKAKFMSELAQFLMYEYQELVKVPGCVHLGYRGLHSSLFSCNVWESGYRQEGSSSLMEKPRSSRSVSYSDMESFRYYDDLIYLKYTYHYIVMNGKRSSKWIAELLKCQWWSDFVNQDR